VPWSGLAGWRLMSLKKKKMNGKFTVEKLSVKRRKDNNI
jgi:hypothetical protein